jgi:PhnB protein
MNAITPYLNFDGTTREAMTFYQQCLGGELFTMGFEEHGFAKTEEEKQRLIHARLTNGRFSLMASDTMPGSQLNEGNNVWLHVDCESDAEVDALYAKLIEGGSEVMGPHDAFWGARFAMLHDRFGCNWMLNHERPRGG